MASGTINLASVATLKQFRSLRALQNRIAISALRRRCLRESPWHIFCALPGKAFRPIWDAARSAPFFKIVTFCNAPPTSIFRRMPEQPRHSWFLGNLAHCLQ